MIFDRRVFFEVLVASIVIEPVKFIVPANTESPGILYCGKDSPVNIDSSILVCPDFTIPSIGIDSPGWISMI